MIWTMRDHRRFATRWIAAGSVLLTACSSAGSSQATTTTTAVLSATTPVPTTTVPTTTAPTTTAPTTTAPTTTTALATTTTNPPPVPIGASFDPAAVGEVSVAGPVTGGKGAIVLGAGGLDLATVGYTESEFFVSGTASAYQSAEPLGSEGLWTVEPVAPAEFTTRVVVRRPIDPAAASGNVAVEWLNVSAGFDGAPDWTFTHTELIRSGWTWVGVSAQEVGIVGRENAIAPLALKLADPVRYAALSHPGDSYSYDIFSQVGAAIRTQWHALLGGIEPTRVVAFGESQSAFRLTTYVNAVATVANVYDGYLVHSRAAAGAPLSQAPLADIATPDPTLIRTDLNVPVLTFITETDLVGDRLRFVRARQPDTSLIRTWEVAGTSHVDLYGLGLGDSDDGTGVADTGLFAAMSAPPNSIYGGIITCDLPINTGPQTYVLRSAVSALAAWIETGVPPSVLPRIELDSSGALVVDDRGNTSGGIRTPQVDVPIATLSGLGQTGASFCGLFGVTTPFDPAQLATAYPNHDAFVSAWNEAVDLAVESGAVLAVDGDRLRTVAAASDIGTLT